ncbi:hypothetical protein ADJ70_13790 [Olsenella sp. oral taxon 807]|uniref:hypothetical protein n=1 Tax=Olsenella sp. oral taxon 807 TaxID=712411 RepID=UPI000679FD6C|nr:hypothetical protein [Olsenella sp. oral taxon 807]AKT49764.1 hypothetical protein ADJ70_13790 [Olsenella sp. oral taxon 807]
MRYIFYWLMIVLPIWQDSPLKSSLGSYGYSFVPLLSLVACVPFLLLTMHKRLVRRGTFTDVWWRLLFYLIAINIIADLVWVLTGNSTVLKGEDIMSKSLRGLLTALSIGSYLMIVSYLAKGYDEERVTRPFFHAFVILTVIAIVEYIQLPNALPWAHYSGIFPYNRPRLLTTEASWTTPLIIVYGGVALHYCFKVKNWQAPGFAVIAAITFMIATTVAKSLLVMVIVAVVVALCVLIRHDARWTLLIVPIVLVVAGVPGIFDKMTELFQSDISQYTSTATRTLSNAVAFLYSLIYPFGTGNALYLQLFPDMLERFQGFFGNMGISLNMSEINTYIYSNSDFGMSAKSAVLQYGMYWGIFETFLLLRALWRSGRVLRKDLRSSRTLYIAYILAVISITLFATFDSQYEFFALMGLLDYYRVTAKEAVLSPSAAVRSRHSLLFRRPIRLRPQFPSYER